ncbi:hypothetical protein [Zavarzinia sp.]|uniref:hypothetical protein n=1 Tax=Zavarzinia sp. TaxID=2027920 RepID=UPI003BB6BA38
MTDQTPPNPWLPGPGWNCTQQGQVFRQNPALAKQMQAEAEAFKAQRRAEEADEGRLLSALSRLDPAAGRAAREAWSKARAGRQA